MGANAGDELSADSRRDARGDRTGRFRTCWHGKTTPRPPGPGSRRLRAVRPAAVAKSRRRDGAGLRAACRQPRTKSHGRPARHPDRGVRGRANQHLTGRSNVAGNPFSKSISFSVMSRGCCASAPISGPGSSRWTGSRRSAPSRPCTASASSGWSSSFRASSAPICRPASPTFAAYGDFATGLLAMLALLTVRIRPLFWLFVVAFNVVGAADIVVDYYHAIQLGPSARGGGTRRHLRDPDPLRAAADDHARRRVLLAGLSVVARARLNAQADVA